MAHASSSLPTRKSGRGGRFNSRSITVLLTANQESSRGSHDLRRHFLQIVFPHETQRYPVTEFRVQAGQPRLDYGGIFSFGQHSDQLKGKSETLFGIPVELASVHPSIDGTHVPDAADVGG